MSRCYYLKKKGVINFPILQKALQEVINDKFTVKLEEYEPTEGEGALIYIENKSSRGVHVFYDNDNVVIKINILSNYEDYILAKSIMYFLASGFKQKATDEEDSEIEPLEYFTDEKIQKLREEDAKTFLAVLKNAKDNIQILGVARKIYFGKTLAKKLLNYESDPKSLVSVIESVINHVQYELPAYNMPGAALIRPRNSDDEKDNKKIRMMFEGNNYILQDYDYLLINPDKESHEIIFIGNQDLLEIAPQVFDENFGYETADDFTVVFPKLEGEGWTKFVNLAREKNHKELLDTKPAAQSVNLTPDYNPETDEKDPAEYQCHGDHWNCILQNPKEEFAPFISASIEKGSLYADSESDYILDGKQLHGRVAMLEYDGGNPESEIVIRNVVAADDDKKLLLVSGYPLVKNGAEVSLKITKIEEWQNGLEAWITAELPDGRVLTFFDTDYSVNKEKYETGNFYNFVISALAYDAEEPKSKGFTFEGQKAIDFKAKMGEEPEYDENGNVKPIQFSTEELCAFFQGAHAEDEAEFITTVEKVESVEAFGNTFWKFNVIYRADSEEDDVKIPACVLKSKSRSSLDKASQVQGLLWLTGYLR